MVFKVVFAPQAHARLEEIVRFIAQDDPAAALRFGNYLVDRTELLAEFPEIDTIPETTACASALVQAI